MTLRELLVMGAERLRAVGPDTASLDASLLLAHLLGVSRAALYARLADDAPAGIAAEFMRAVARREGGEPIAYVVGHKEFFGLDFAVTPAVLVPRPETELLVQWAVDWLRARVLPARVVDVGTGSGAIAVTLAHTIATASVLASDISLGALQVARGNARHHAMEGRIGFVRGDLLSWLGQPADLVLANLPYLSEAQMGEPSIAAEPRLALIGGDADGFGLYRRLIPQVAKRLMPGGAFAFEIDPAQREIAVAACEEWLPKTATRLHRDLAGHARFITVEAALDPPRW
jgi:release factor glutamine methyltransferase